jgi:hypothetical protein
MVTSLILSKESRFQEKLARRALRVEAALKAGKLPGHVAEAFFEEIARGEIPEMRRPDNFSLKDHFRASAQPGVIAELITQGQFGANWRERIEYEFDAGRDMEPTVYEPIYAITTAAELEENVTIDRIGPAGVVFEEVKEGGEVKFASVNASDDTVRIKHYAVGLQYTEDLYIYNKMWRITELERQFGTAHNALLNNVHLSPIISANYTGDNVTDGTALTSFRATADLAEKYVKALEAAITTATDEPVNPRRGPYILLMNTGGAMTMSRALTRVAQQGFDAQGVALDMIRNIIIYNGWTGVRGQKKTTYAGVQSGYAYLIDLSMKTQDFRSFVKHGLRMTMGEGDASRFIMKENIWDSRFGVFAAPQKAVHKIQLPVAASGQA